MIDTKEIKRFVIPNIPYVFLWWFFAKVGEAYRISPGQDTEKRVKKLDEHLANCETFKKYRKIREKYDALNSEYESLSKQTGLFAKSKTEKAHAAARNFYEEHRSELSMYAAAEKYLRDTLQKRYDPAKLPTKKWRDEREACARELAGIDTEYTVLKSGVQDAETIKRLRGFQDEFTYRDALRNAAEELAREGIKVYDSVTGKSLNVVSAVRSNVLTEANRMAARITEEGMRRHGISHVFVSAHIGARNTGLGFRNHERWQGKVYYWRELGTFGGNPGNYPDFLQSTGYGDVAGLCGINCRHSFGAYIPGVIPGEYDPELLDEYANKTVTYTDPSSGDEVTVLYYYATQLLRSYERKIHSWKLRRDAKAAIGEDRSLETRKVRQWQRRAEQFIRQTGIQLE